MDAEFPRSSLSQSIEAQIIQFFQCIQDEISGQLLPRRPPDHSKSETAFGTRIAGQGCPGDIPGRAARITLRPNEVSSQPACPLSLDHERCVVSVTAETGYQDVVTLKRLRFRRQLEILRNLFHHGCRGKLPGFQRADRHYSSDGG